MTTQISILQSSTLTSLPQLRGSIRQRPPLLRETDFYVSHWLPEDDFRLQVRYDTVLIDRSPTLVYDELPYGQYEEDPDLI